MLKKTYLVLVIALMCVIAKSYGQVPYAPETPATSATVSVSTKADFLQAINKPNQTIVITRDIVINGRLEFKEHNHNIVIQGNGNALHGAQFFVHKEAHHLRFENIQIQDISFLWLRIWTPDGILDQDFGSFYEDINRISRQRRDESITRQEYYKNLKNISATLQRRIEIPHDIALIGIQTEDHGTGLNTLKGLRIHIKDCTFKSREYGCYGTGPIVDLRIENSRFETTRAKESGFRAYHIYNALMTDCHFLQQHRVTGGIKPTFRLYSSDFVRKEQCKYTDGRIILGQGEGPAHSVSFLNCVMDHSYTAQPIVLENGRDINMINFNINSKSQPTAFRSDNTQLTLRNCFFRGRPISDTGKDFIDSNPGPDDIVDDTDDDNDDDPNSDPDEDWKARYEAAIIELEELKAEVAAINSEVKILEQELRISSKKLQKIRQIADQ